MINIDNKVIGSRIKSIRKEAGMTTEEFANIFNPPASKGTVSKWENGHYLPNNTRLKKIAELGNTTVDKLLYGEINSKYDIEDLKNSIIDISLAPFQQNAFDNVINALNKAPFLNFGLTDIFLMYTNNISEKDYQIKDLLSLLQYLKDTHKRMSGYLDNVPENERPIFQGYKNELDVVQHQINQIEEYLNN